MVLAGVVLILILVIIYLATHLTRHASKAQRHWLTLPSHFTIPILSPFTSVVSPHVYDVVLVILRSHPRSSKKRRYSALG